MEGLFALFFIVIGIIQLAMVIKFFEMAGNISKLTRNMDQFTKYYYSMQEFKNQNYTTKQISEKDVITKKPLAEKLSIEEYERIYKVDNDRFMDIANYFYKNDKDFYDNTLLQILERNSGK